MLSDLVSLSARAGTCLDSVQTIPCSGLGQYVSQAEAGLGWAGLD